MMIISTSLIFKLFFHNIPDVIAFTSRCHIVKLWRQIKFTLDYIFSYSNLYKVYSER